MHMHIQDIHIQHCTYEQMLCKMLNIRKDVILEELGGARICRKCLPPLILQECVQLLSVGECVPCESCPAGSFREGCIPGGSEAGVCTICPNANVSAVARMFKPIAGLPTDKCLPCTVCGGINQNGTAREKARCTETRDTVCVACEPCTGRENLRVGCAGSSAGQCEEFRNVSHVLSTTTIDFKSQWVSAFRVVTTELLEANLTGSFAGIRLQVPRVRHAQRIRSRDLL
jgi:hypothetical protein